MEKKKEWRVTEKRLKEILSDIVKGMKFPRPGKAFAEALFKELKKRTEEEEGMILGDEQFGNMIREIDALVLEFGVTHLLLQKIQGSLDSQTRFNFKDRRTERRKPIEELHIYLVSN